MRARKTPEHPFNADSTTAPARPEFLTVAETGRVLRVCGRTIGRYLKAGDLRHVRLRGKILVLRASLDLFIAQRTVGGGRAA